MFSDDSTEASVTQTLLALNRAEQQQLEEDQNYETGVTSSTWILEGIEIEIAQYASFKKCFTRSY